MPGSLQLAAPTTVLPNSLSTSFTLTSTYPVLFNFYNDGTIQRSMISDGVNAPRVKRVWRISRRLTVIALSTLYTFWQARAGGHQPFYYYDPFDYAFGLKVGSNYDASGVSTQGRRTVHFSGDWSHTIGIGRSSGPELVLVELT